MTRIALLPSNWKKESCPIVLDFSSVETKQCGVFRIIADWLILQTRKKTNIKRICRHYKKRSDNICSTVMLKCIPNEWLVSFVGAYCITFDSEENLLYLNHFCPTSLLCARVHTCVFVFYFSLQHFPYSLTCKDSPLTPFPSATSLCSLSPSAFNPWLETAGAALSGGHVQSGEHNRIQKGEAEIVGNVYFVIGRKTVFLSSFFPNHMSICI